ncbi:EF-hand domain-containing protein 1-like [Saccoglossus kowalevskii]|uniref:EF-hand domain-containing protein 1-like n=1 Tax=Saccoglossus kowalevskii TaxID=10224 RepID=A0ABM0GXT7_SACKO|nr:PREDICTED: EF-hand domain-containing protein 1-like [Saccoglossus kowalevskii]
MALPFLPGNSFNDPTKGKYHRSHSLGYRNGYALPTRPEVGIGGTPLPVNQLSESELDELANLKPSLTYGQAKQAPPEDFIPAHVAFDKKVLKFHAYFKQTVHESANEHYRIRPVNIFYYLEDDSISVVEPHVENSGMPQGKLIKRQRLPKNDQGDHWHWKDFNLGINVTFYGKIFRVIDCDQFSKQFMASEGIDLNEPEQVSSDPYIETRKEAASLRTYTTKSSFDKLKQFIDLDRKVLRFYCVWDDRDSMFGEIRPYTLQYYLVDDTVEVREVHGPNDGRDPFPLLLRRQKLPKDRYNVESSFPSVVMELSDHEIKDWYTPRDLSLGSTIYIFNRRFLIYDCDDFTKAYLNQKYGMTNFTPIDVKGENRAPTKSDLPPYNGFGSLEDSLQSCLSLIPQPPKKDFIKMLENDLKVLRFAATMDSVRPEDKGRRFIISYRLADDMMMIYEPPVRNSGIIGGKFLERTRVTKPGSVAENPDFYGPQDMFIGARIQVFNHRFIITDADDFVLHYLEARPSDFPGSERTAASIRELKMSQAGQPVRTPVKGAPLRVQRVPGDTQRLVEEVQAQLRKSNYLNHIDLRTAFLKHDGDRTGRIDAAGLKEICNKNNLPIDDDIIDALIANCDLNNEGLIDYEGFIRCLSWA